MRRSCIVVALAVAGLAACRQAAPPAEPGNRPAAATVPDATEDGAGDDIITMRYRCDGGHGITIVGGETARVTLPDGRVAEIARVSGSAPPRFGDEALSVEVDNRGASLVRHNAGRIDCSKAE